MFKLINAVIAAAAVAAVITALTTASAPLDASPVAEPAQTAMKACNQQPWPYLNCVGTPFGNPNVRLIKVN